MPAYRNIAVSSRRSRRLSQQEPRNYAEDKWESYGALSSDRQLINPDAFPSPTLSVSTSSSKSPSEFSLIRCSEPRRASHSRRQPEGHIPRPPNAFLMFRSEFWEKEKLKEQPIERNHRNISRIVSHCWNSLGDEEKARYQTLAEQRKQLHLLEHPDYKYAPASHPSKVTKKKPKKESNKGDEEEKERCRKLAALVMDGLSSSAIQEVMKGNKKTPRNRPSKARQPPPRCYRRASNTSLPAVPSSTRELVAGDQRELWQEQPVGTFLSEGFVPNDEIPHLDLSAPKDEQVLTPDFDTSIRPPGYDAIGSQFGFKPAISQFNPSTCFWYTPDDVMSVEDDLASPLSDNSLLSMVKLKNPFEYMVATDLDPASDQVPESVSRHVPLTLTDDIDSALVAYNTDIGQYLHFDY